MDYEEYARVSAIIKTTLRTFSAVMEDIGIDEAFLDISECEKASEEIAHEIKGKVRDETGLTCSIGIAPNKLLAKIASDMQKPDGLTILTDTDIESRIWPLPVRKLWGVGPKTEAYLIGMTVQTIGDLAIIPLEALIRHFGESYGSYLYEASRGIDNSPLVTYWEPKSASRETTFQSDTDDWQTIARVLAELARDVVDDLTEKKYQGKSITVKIRFSNFRTQTRTITLDEPTDDLETIRKAAFSCLGRFDLRQKVRLVGMRAGKLTRKQV